MSTFEFNTAILDETVYLLDDAAKLTISAKNANVTTVINLNKVSTVIQRKIPMKVAIPL